MTELSTPLPSPALPRIRRLLLILLAAVVILTLPGLLRELIGRPGTEFSRMEYTRPDTEKLFSQIDAMLEAAEKGESYGEMVKGYLAMNLSYADYLSQSLLCYIRYSLDTADEFYSEEQSFFNEQDSRIAQKLDGLYRALARSEFAGQLEKDYFGEGFFDRYRNKDSAFSEKAVELLQKEKELQNAYNQLLSDPKIPYQGKEQSYRKLMESITDPALFSQLTDLLYETYNPKAAEIYCELIRTRKALAKELGYEGYADYAYYNLKRSFSPEEGKHYCDSVRESLAPLYAEQSKLPSAPLYRLPEEDLWLFTEAAVKEKGGEFQKAFDYMRKYSLCRLSSKDSRAPGSFTTYLFSYNAPVIVAEQTETSLDLTTVIHEFGHFFDHYLNYGSMAGTDLSECASQGMEMLLFSHLDAAMLPTDAQNLMNEKLQSMLQVIGEQCAFHDFEFAAYELSDEELSADSLNELAKQLLPADALSYAGSPENASLTWIGINHFFTAPFYTVSYALSADVALQFYQLEQEGQADQAYLALLQGEEKENLSEALVTAGLLDPFDPHRIPAIQTLYTDLLKQ